MVTTIQLSEETKRRLGQRGAGTYEDVIKKMLSNSNNETLEELRKIKGLTHWGLPIRDDKWEWLVHEVNNKTISAGTSENLWFRADEAGFVTSVHAYMDNPNLEFELRLDQATWKATVAALYAMGYVDLGQPGTNVILYDTTNSVYTMMYVAFGYPGDPYKKTSWFKVTNPTSSDITLTWAQLNRIVIKPEYVKEMRAF